MVVGGYSASRAVAWLYKRVMSGCVSGLSPNGRRGCMGGSCGSWVGVTVGGQ